MATLRYGRGVNREDAGCVVVRWDRAEGLARLSDAGIRRYLFDADMLVIDLGDTGLGDIGPGEIGPGEIGPAPPPEVLDALRRAPCVTVGIRSGSGRGGGDAVGVRGDRGGVDRGTPALDAALDVLLAAGSTDVRLVAPPPVDTAGGTGAAGAAGALEALCRAVAANPGAARTLVQVLRTTESMGVGDALVVESLAYSMLLASPPFLAWLAARPTPRTKSETEDVVVLTRDGDTWGIVLNRPHVHNAFNAALRDGLVEALVVPILDPSIAAIEIRGAGPTFCSGGDLNEFGSSPDVGVAHAIRTTQSVGAAIDRVRARTTVLVHGPCVGAGLELPAFAGTVVADPGTTFRLPEVAMGLIPGAGGTVSIARRIGRQRAALLALTGATIGAPTALEWGLVDSVEPVRPVVLPASQR